MEERRKRLQSILKTLGLTDKEAEVYLAISLKGSATVKDLLESLRNIHQPQLYNILSSLMRKGFIRASMGRPKTYRAINLEALFESKKILLDNLKTEAVRLVDQLRRVEEEVRAEETLVSLVKGYEGLEAAIVEVLAGAQLEVCAELPTQVLVSIVDILEKLLSRGVNLYLLAFPEIPDHVLNRLARYRNLKLRRNNLGSFLMVSADTRVAVYARRRFYSPRKMPIPETEVYGFYITERDLIWRLLNIFEVIWREAEELISWPLAPESYPKTFLEFGMGLLELENLLSRGFKPYVEVEGRSVKSREIVNIEGWVIDVARSTYISNFTVDFGGRRVTVGGFDAEVEDLEAIKVVIKRVEK